MHDPHRMVSWYDPPRLVATGIRVAISTVFGEFADRREAMGLGRSLGEPIEPPKVYESDGDFWFDFVADCGDGWNPTYAIARLLALPAIRPAGHDADLPRGRFLVMGGDQIYPTASRESYDARLVTPYDRAAGAAGWEPGAEGDLYAVPGNHDWYDGLSAFTGLFCARRPQARGRAAEGRRIGNRFARQTRSYFALKLPQRYWLWGADVQLSGYIDQPQVAFFERIAGESMEPGSRVILCTAEPRWAYTDTDPAPGERERFKNFAFLEHLVTAAGRNHSLALVLAGDSHHYARHTEEGRNYVTSGGGGAFLHPTHHLRDRVGVASDLPAPGRNRDGGPYRRDFRIARDPNTGAESLFPRREASRALNRGNLGFALRNWQFTATLFGLFLVFNWLLHANARIAGTSLAEALSGGGLRAYGAVMVVSPWPALFALAACGGFYYFADYGHGWKRFGLGIGHALAHFAVVAGSALLLAGWAAGTGTPGLLLVVGASLLAAPLAASVFGLYLIASLELLGRHWNEAFSALRVEDWKNFLRLRIGADGLLTLYPIGLERVPRDDAREGPRDPALEPRLIEGPVVIDPTGPAG